MHLVLWALLVLFVLSMSVGGLVGGANIIDRILGKTNPAAAIGVINDEEIPPEYFNTLVSQQLTQARASGQVISDRQLEIIREQVWESIVRDLLIRDVINEMKITATNGEVLFNLRNNPPPFLSNLPAFQTDGQFDPVKYQQAINNPQGNEWIEVEQYMKHVYLPGYKLQQMLKSGAVVTDSDVHNTYIKRNVEYTVDALHITDEAMDEEFYHVTDDDIAAEYQVRKDEFMHDEKRDLRAAIWLKSPTREDTTLVLQEAGSIMDRINQGEDFAQLANEYTEDPGNRVSADSSRGGYLGWFGRGQMVPEFEEAAFNAKVGDVVGPVGSQFGFHIIKIHDRKMENDREQLLASHILLKVELGPNSRDVLRRQANLFSYDALDFGFEAASDSTVVEVIDLNDLEENASSLNTVGPMRAAVRFAFNSEVGEISPVLENDDYYAVFSFESITPAGPTPLDQVYDLIKRDLEREKQRSILKSLSDEIRAKINVGKSFDDIMAEYENIEFIDSSRATLNRGFESIGRTGYLIGALLHSTEQMIVGPVQTTKGYAIVKIRDIADINFEDYEVQKNSIRRTLINTRQNEFYTTWMEDYKAKADIEDFRHYHY
jgi:parvulin-like peptidyl-prolyl isomerase